MADGTTHTSVTIGVTVGIGAGYACAYFFYPYHMVAVVLGALWGILCGPDQDVDDGNISNYYLRKIFPPLEWYWSAFWMPYKVGVKHRSWISHFPIISTVIRFTYLLFPVIINVTSDQDQSTISSVRLIFLSLISQILSAPFFIIVAAAYFYLPDWQVFFLAFFTGATISDVLHYLFDVL